MVSLSLVLSCMTCHAQTAFQGLTPGKSTRAEAERVFGQPVKSVSETLIEYRAQPLTSKVYVQYRKNLQVVERIEVLCKLEKSSCSDFLNQLHLPMTDNDWEATAGEDILTQKNYYRAPYYIVLTGNFDNWQRTAFYSRELYEAAIQSPGVKAVFGRCPLCPKEKQKPATVSRDGTTPAQAPDVIKACETFQRQVCGTWTLQGNHFEVQWENGIKFKVTIEQFDKDRVALNGVIMTPQGEISVAYSGRISGNKIEGGTVTEKNSYGQSLSGTWTASW